jgi:hypothetical protein
MSTPSIARSSKIYPKTGIFGLEICHLATLLSNTYDKFFTITPLSNTYWRNLGRFGTEGKNFAFK